MTRMPPSAASVATSVRSSRSSLSTRSRAVLRTGDAELRSRLLNKLGIFGKIPSDALEGARDNVRLESAVISDPAADRRTNMLRGVGYGGIIPQAGLPPQGVVDAGDEARIRPKLCDAVQYHEPLKWKESPPKRNSFLGSFGSGGGGSPRKISPSGRAPSNDPTTTSAAASNKKGGKSSPKKNHKGHTIHFSPSVSVVQIPMRSEYSSRIKSRIWSDRYEIHENATRNAVEFAAEGWDWRRVTEDDGMFVCTVSGELVHPVHCSQFYSNQQASSSDGRQSHHHQQHEGGQAGAADFDAEAAAALSASSS